jgi:hypothetical protein
VYSTIIKNSTVIAAGWVFGLAVIFGDEITIVRDGNEQTLQGEILVEAQNDNGLLFQEADGRLWAIQANELKSKTIVEEAVSPDGRREIGNSLQEQLGAEFQVHEAGNFVIVYDTEKAYARWVGGVYRRLERGFINYWRSYKFKLADKPEFPMPVIVFRHRSMYEDYMRQDLGTVNANMIAYYNLETNRVAMFDLTSDDLQGDSAIDDRQINQVLDNPRAIPMVATMVHEATHQLMFNYGMQTRFADTPLWVNEGLAMFFETPDLSASQGWRGIGKVNFLRLGPCLSYLQIRPADSLAEMIRSDKSFRGEQTLSLYAQAWAFNYFLLNKHKREYVAYLRHMSAKPRLIEDTPEQRLAEFQQFFDSSLDELDRSFVHFIRGINR